jgi:hypothetical protein
VKVSETASAKYILHIPLPTPSLNEWKVAPSGAGRWKYTSVRRTWHKWIPPAPYLFRRFLKSPGYKTFITVQRVMGPRNRPLDYDNMVGGFKPVLDILKAKNWMVDDDPKHLAETTFTQDRGLEGATVITLAALPGPSGGQ